jgi:Flp pilus assembly protein TadG
MLEFGIVVPFFFVFIMGIAYFGAAISDYIALNNMARSCAREASLSGPTTYKNLQNEYLKKDLTAGLYEWGPQAYSEGLAWINVDKDISEATTGNHGNVVVNLHSEIDMSRENAATIFKRLLIRWAGASPKVLDLDVTYTMYSEYDLSQEKKS